MTEKNVEPAPLQPQGKPGAFIASWQHKKCPARGRDRRATLGFLASSRARPELQLLSTLGRWTKVQWRHRSSRAPYQ